jgi:hypothetical protein
VPFSSSVLVDVFAHPLMLFSHIPTAAAVSTGTGVNIQLK